MGLFDFMVDVAADVALGAVEGMGKDTNQQTTTSPNAVDPRTITLSEQGAMLLASALIMYSGSNDTSRIREKYRLYSIDRRNGSSRDLKEALAIIEYDYSSLEELFLYAITVVTQTLQTEEERLCAITNMLDIAMVDGDVDEDEMARIELFIEAFEVDLDTVKTIYAVLEIKNKQLIAKY